MRDVYRCVARSVRLCLLVSGVAWSGWVGAQGLTALSTEPEQNSGSNVEVKVSGFYSLTGLQLSERSRFYAYIPYGDLGQGHDRRGVDWGLASKAGLMLQARMGARWQAGLQLMARQGADDASKVNPTQAFVQWSDGGWVAKFGRTVPGLWLVEDSYYVDFAHLWLKAPVEMYGWRPTPELDGVSLARHFTWGDWYGKVQASYGSRNAPYRSYRRDFAQVRALSLDVSQGELQLRAAFNDSQVNVLNLPSYEGFLATIRPQVPAQYAPNFQTSLNTRYHTVGASWTPGNWTLQAEWARNFTDQIYLAPFQTGYLLAGHRWGRWTPYVMWSSTHGQFGQETRFSPSINALVDSLQRTLHNVQDNVTLGVRVDLNSQTALKFQAENIRRDAGQVGSFTPPPGGPSAPAVANSTRLWSISLQGVF